MTDDDYCDPFDVNKPTAQVKDDYSDPWDSRPDHIVKPKVKKSGLKDEYIDPWDANGPQNPNQATDSDDENYIEPYDSGKVTALDEQAKRMSLKGMMLPSAGHAEHDHHVKPQTQFEDSRPNHNDDSESYEFMNKQGHEYCNIPSSRPTPAEPQSPSRAPVVQKPHPDHDNTFVIGKSLSLQKQRPQTQFEDSRANHNDDSESYEFMNKQGHEYGNIPSSRPTPAEPPRVNPDHDNTLVSLPLKKQSWYHGPITRVEAENLLEYEENGSFLVRDRESSNYGEYSLSFKNNNTVMHLKIEANPHGKYVLGQFSQPYDTVPEIIDYYARNKLNIRSAVHSYLKNPIASRYACIVVEDR